MSRAYTADGRRISSMGHAKHGHKCDLCGRVVFGNGGKVAHGRGHVRRGEAVELEKYYGSAQSMGRIFFAPGDPRVAEFEARGYVAVAS